MQELKTQNGLPEGYPELALQPYLTGSHQDPRTTSRSRRIPRAAFRQKTGMNLILIIKILRLSLRSSGFPLTGFDDFALDGGLVVFALAFLVTFIFFITVFFVFLVGLGLSFTVLFFVVIGYDALLGLVGVWVRDGGFGAFDACIGGGGGCGAGFALLGCGRCRLEFC